MKELTNKIDNKIRREGTIAAELTESEKCLEFREKKETNIINLGFVKEQVAVSFMIEAKGWENVKDEDVKEEKLILREELRIQLGKAFNGVSGLEKISFTQDYMLPVNENIENLNLDEDSTLHLIDFQILLKQNDTIKYNTSLEDSIISGLEIAARITARMLAIVVDHTKNFSVSNFRPFSCLHCCAKLRQNAHHNPSNIYFLLNGTPYIQKTNMVHSQTPTDTGVKRIMELLRLLR